MLFGFRSSLLEEKEVQCPQCCLLMKVEIPICPHCGHGVTEEELAELTSSLNKNFRIGVLTGIFFAFAIVAWMVFEGVSGRDDTIFSIQMERWEASKKNSLYLSHLEKISSFNNLHAIDDSADCYNISEGKVELVFAYNAEGVIFTVASKHENRRSMCFKNLYLNGKFPVPPYSPFYERVLFE